MYLIIPPSSLVVKRNHSKTEDNVLPICKNKKISKSSVKSYSKKLVMQLMILSSSLVNKSYPSEEVDNVLLILR